MKEESTDIQWELVTRRDKRIMDKMDHYTLAIWACELNSWKWPKGLPNEEKAFNKDGTYRGSKRRRAVRYYIEFKIGLKYSSFIWNTEYRKDWDKMSPSEWREWWANEHPEESAENSTLDSTFSRK